MHEFKGMWVFDDELPTSWPNWRSMGCEDRDGGKLDVALLRSSDCAVVRRDLGIVLTFNLGIG